MVHSDGIVEFDPLFVSELHGIATITMVRISSPGHFLTWKRFLVLFLELGHEFRSETASPSRSYHREAHNDALQANDGDAKKHPGELLRQHDCGCHYSKFKF